MINQLTHFEPVHVALRDERRRGLAEGEREPGQVLRQSRKIGVLLSNLGTPDATDYWSIGESPETFNEFVPSGNAG